MRRSGQKQRTVREIGIKISKDYIYSILQETGSARFSVTPISFMSTMTNQYNQTNVMYLSFTVAVSLQPCHSHLTLYARTIPNSVCVAPPEDEQVMLETCRGL
jgi:hypothetical protein